MFFKLVFVHVAMVSVLCAPRSRGTSTTYDQKQAGEYNIQLHLKDFQIIALVGDDPLGSFGGDYDYNYDYSDFTMKPIIPTKKPDNATEKPIILSTKPTSPITEKTPIIIDILSPPPTTLKPSSTTSEPIVEIQSSTISSDTSTTIPITINATVEKESTTDVKELPGSMPGQIPVFVQDFSIPSVTLIKNDRADQRVEAFTNVAIVTDDSGTESNDHQQHPALGEILHYRRCPQGYGRDKRGRCRKVRRPQLPIGISRFASNLAARFRQSSEGALDPSE